MRLQTLTQAQRAAVRVALIYLILGAGWIAFSDLIASTLWPLTSPLHDTVQTLKGWAYVLATSALLYLLVERSHTRRSALEQSLATMETLGRAVFASANDAILVLDERWNVLEAGGKAVEMYGLSAKDLARKNLRDFRADGSGRELETRMREVSSTGSSRWEARHRRANGEEFPVEVTARVVNAPATLIAVVRDVTERHAALERLRRNEEHLRLSIAASHQGTYDLDVSAGRVRTNDEYARMLGYDPATFVETPAEWVENIHPDDRAASELAFQRCVDGHTEVYRMESRRRTKDGGWKWILSVGEVVERGPDGRATRIMGTHTDVTAQRQTELELRRSERTFSAFMDHLPGFAYLKDEGRRHVFVNRALELLLRHSADECEGRTIEELIGREAPSIRESDERVLGTRRPLTVEETFDVGGEERVFQSTKFPVAIEGTQTLLGGISFDITERKREREAMERSELLHRSLFENMQEGYAYCRMIYNDGAPEDFVYLAVNDAFARLTGLENVVGKRVSEVIPGIRQTDPELFELYGAVTATGEPRKFEIFVASLDHWFSLSVYRPEPEHFVAVFDVITERKRKEAEVELSRDRLRSLALRMDDARESERKRIARDIHDGIGQELTAIRMALSYAMQKSIRERVSEGVLHELKEVGNLTDRAVQTVRRLATDLRPEILDRLGLPDALRWHAAEFTKRTGIPCAVDIEGMIPAVDEVAATALFRVFQEALTNVVRHASARTAGASLRVRDGLVELEVIDDGIGIKGRDTEKRASLGILGMRERLELLGGSITLAPRSPSGTRLRALVPLGSLARLRLEGR